MKLSRISRVVRLLTMLQSGQNYSVDDLTELLGVNRRTLFRDLEQLRAIGVPYSYSAKAGGYSIDPDFFLPPIDLNLQEALSLLMLVHKMKGHIPIPFKNSAVMAGLKIENILPDDIRQYCNAHLSNVSVRPIAHSTMESLDRVFTSLQKAIRKKQVIKINYHSLFEQKDIGTNLSPYHLMYNKRAWYVVGKSSMHKSVRTFKLNRIKHLEILDRRFVNDKQFDTHEYLGRAWSMMPEGRIYNIKLRFLPKVAKNVAEVHWHSTQKVQRNQDGSVTVEFRVDGLNEISWWILGYGDQVEVLAPMALRKRIIAAGQKMVAINQAL